MRDIVERLRASGMPIDPHIDPDIIANHIEYLRQQLAESQAREKALRDGYRKILSWPYLSDELRRAVTEPLAIPSDSTALDAAIAKAKREVSQTTAASDVLTERQRQREVEGWNVEHDDAHAPGELSRAAGSYAINAGAALHFNGGNTSIVSDNPPYGWPWAPKWWKPTNSRRDLVKAGALILAEIERIDRMADELKGGEQ